MVKVKPERGAGGSRAGGSLRDADDDTAVAAMQDLWAEVSRAYARFLAAVGEVGRRAPTRWADEEIAAALTFTSRRAGNELALAWMLDDLPAVFGSLAAAQIDHPKARVFADQLEGVAPEVATALCERFVPIAPRLTTGQLAARLRRAVLAADPGHARRKYERALAERGVHGYLDHSGTAVLSARGLSVAEAAAAAARLDALAASVRAAGYPATKAQT